MDRMTIKATTRKNTGKGYAKRLRAEGKMPAVMYNWKGEATSLELEYRSFYKIWSKTTKTTLFNLEIDGKKPVLASIKDTDYEIIKDSVLHADFHVINEKNKLRTPIRVGTTGSPKGIRDGGVFVKGIETVMIECFPKDLPERIVADISNLELQDQILVKDLHFGKGVEVLTDPEEVIGTVRFIKEEIEEEEVDTEIETDEETDGETDEEADAATAE